MRLAWSRIFLKLAGSFNTAVARRTSKETIWVRVSHDGTVGWGEAVPMDTYAQTLETAEQALSGIASILEKGPFSDPHQVESITGELLSAYDGQRATVAAVDAAIHDWLGKRYGLPVTTWLGLDSTKFPLTSYTIGIDEPDLIAPKIADAAEYPILKIKVGTPRDEETLRLIRRLAPTKILRVDANGGWSLDQALAMLPVLADFGVEYVEQPIARNDLTGLRRLKEQHVLPIVADESCVHAGSVAALADCVDGINIKLSKCGGIREAIRMIHIARGVGLRIMLGCMIESSLGIAAAAQLAPLVDWLDLDGHLLLAEDPFIGLGGQAGRLTIGTLPGLGVQLKGDAVHS